MTEQRWDAALYDDKHAFVWQRAAGLVELLRPQAGERILDLGCGTGHLTAQLAAAGAEVLGIDRSPEMVAQVRRAYPHLRFAEADARDFALPELFDAVFSNATLHWVSESARVIASVYRALRPGGRFVAEFGGKGNVQGIITAMEAAAQRLGLGPLPPLWNFPGIPEYTGLLESGGLDVTYAELFDRPTPLEGETGLRDWLRMFANPVLERIAAEQREAFLRQVEEAARPTLSRAGQWFADYRRLRVVAWRSAA
jgi:trans-aconitate 2-methyltransferase